MAWIWFFLTFGNRSRRPAVSLFMWLRGFRNDPSRESRYAGNVLNREARELHYRCADRILSLVFFEWHGRASGIQRSYINATGGDEMPIVEIAPGLSIQNWSSVSGDLSPLDLQRAANWLKTGVKPKEISR
jgi:hypothetical protein